MQQEMKYVYQVYLDGSISKAAEHLYITQPALSISIQKIESALGMPLFDRGTRPLTLTQAGEIYIETIRQTLYLEQEMEQQMEDIRKLNSGNIRIGGSHYLNAYILPEILTGFNRKYPGIRLQLVEASSAELAGMLSERELDLTFNCDPEFLMNFERYPAFYDQVILAVPKDDPVNDELSSAALSARDIIGGILNREDCPLVSLDYFRDVEFLLLSKGNNLHDRSRKLFEEAGFEPRVKMELAQLATAFHLADHAMAATFVSDRLVTAEYDHLCYYKLKSELATRMFYILLPRRKYTSFAVREFIKYFTGKISEIGHRISSVL